MGRELKSLNVLQLNCILYLNRYNMQAPNNAVAVLQGKFSTTSRKQTFK